MKRLRLVPICAVMIASSYGFVACSSSDSPSTPDLKDSGAGDAADDKGAIDASHDASPSDDATPPNDAATDKDNEDASTDPTYTVTVGSCFDFATLSEVPDCSSGELRTLRGGNVDLSSNDERAELICQLPGTYTQLADVPSDYSSCEWVATVEGIAGLADHGLIVRDSFIATHHYRVRIISNTLPSLIFSVATID